MLTIKIKKLKNDATLPSYAHVGDAGMDIYASEDVHIRKGERGKVPTGIAIEIPDGYVGLVWDKSGLSINHGLKTLGGVIDAGYRGEIIIGIANLSSEDYTIEKGHKVAQLLIQKIEAPNVQEVGELSDSHLPAPRPGIYFVYAILCDDGSIYVGQTDNLQKRWNEHLEGTGAEHTKKHKPVKVIHSEEYDSREKAIQREKDLKTGFGKTWLKREFEAGRTRQAGRGEKGFGSTGK